ncbi:GNAT family N-acetyltransferase [Rossellomorea vietnamensis]|uniref:GNAT family N-acetyltransferase n=2 Tax=Bacillaceae TaxID=186817 RepID=A0A5D4MI56_9BACI|nr:GNAT family N-acetyltransferase [Rossellomorea vietnamensis]
MIKVKIMKNEEIINAIGAHHWDYEKEWIPSYIETIDQPGLKAVKNPRMKNVFSNKVIELTSSDSTLMEKWGKVKSFFGENHFSLWLERSESRRVAPILEQDGFEITDRYDGLAFMLKELNDMPAENSQNSSIQLTDVKTDEEIHDLVEVSSIVWNYHKDQYANLFEQRKNYIASPYRNGGYILARKDSEPAGYSNYRFSSDGRTMFMNGSGVLSEYRHQGIYTEMVNFRLKHAKNKGAVLATCQARQGHSSPVLKKLGFNLYAEYDYWVYNR